MRDFLVTSLVLGAVPFILARPYIGILVWSWITYMNPHRLTWGFAYDMPFAQIVGVVTIGGLLFSREPKQIPMGPLTVLWIVFIVWMGVTTLFAIEPADAWEQYTKVLKIQLMVLLTLLLINNRQRIDLLVWCIVLSIGFYSVKGGLFTLLTGGGSRVFGPPGGFIAENNSLATATLMIIPLMHYLRQQANARWVKLGLLGAMMLSVVSVMGSHSRGAFVAAIAVGAFFWWRSRRKVATALAIILLVPPVLMFMPESWHERIGTIKSESRADVSQINSMRTRDGSGTLSQPIASRDWLGYWPSDFSALGRVNAWNYAINVANSRVTGAGFDSWSSASFALYAPIVEEVQAAHSIFFSVLADHGWFGLTLFLSILLVAWISASRVIRAAEGEPSLGWAAELMRMVQVSLIAYCIGGAFLSLAYYDLPWHLIAIVMLSRHIVVGRRGDARNVAAGVLANESLHPAGRS